MSTEEFKFSNKTLLLEEKETVSSSYKISSYKQKLKMMEEQKIPQKPIKEVIEHLFSDKNKIISLKTKNSISKIIYSQRDRIIIAITRSGRDIIFSRTKLIRDYGWFFFVSESEDKGKEKKKRKKRQVEQKLEEKTISIEEFQFQDNKIALKEKENMRSLYHTKEYFQYFKLLKTKKVPQKLIKEVLNDLFFKNNKIPKKEKNSIQKVIYYKKEKVIVVKSLIGDKMYENLKNLVLKYGWYFYITGVPVGDSEISLAIDKIEKRFDKDYFKEISLSSGQDLQNKRVTIYPIVTRPNHNCHILGLGKLNILLDCGITEHIKEEILEKEEKKEKEDLFKVINEYLEKLPNWILKEENKRKKELKVIEHESEEEILEKIDQLREFDKKKEDILEDKAVIEQKSVEFKIFDDDFKPKIDAIFVSHSHYDHISGLKRLVQLYPDVPIICSRITLDLFLLRDSKFLKQEHHDEIEEEEYLNIVKNVIYVENGEKIEFKDKKCYLAFFHAGHMPGALMLSARVNDFRLLYTGDYTTEDYTPFAGTGRFLNQISRPIDYLLIDAVSAYEEFDTISEQLHSLILFMEQKAEYGDNCLIGADPSSLAITFMLVFWRYFRKLQLRKNYKKRPNIYVDLMVRKNIQVINHRYEYIYGPISKLIRDKANPFNSIKFRWFGINDLDFLRTKNNIIISHPPDLSYGIIRNVINSVGRNPHNLVFLSGAIHEEPGLSLVSDDVEKKIEEEDLESIVADEKIEEDADKKLKKKKKFPEIEFYETWKMPFRALLLNKFAPNLKIKLHGDKKQLTEMIKNLEPKEVCFFHQSPRKLIDVAEYVKELGVKKVSVSRRGRLKILN